MVFLTVIFSIACLALMALFIKNEHDEKYVPAVILKGSASLCFVILGIIGAGKCSDAALAKLIIIGLIFGCVADIMLNLRYLSKEKGQLIFIIGTLIFLSGHIIYLAALIPASPAPWLVFGVAVVLAALTMVWIFSKITAKMSLKIVGVFYIGAVMLMACMAVGNMIANFSAHSVVFALGGLLFLVSDVVLILNTFGGKPKFELRVTNLSLYYIGQILIALSLQLF